MLRYCMQPLPIPRLKGPLLRAFAPDGAEVLVRVVAVDRARRVASVVKPNGMEATIPCAWLYLRGGRQTPVLPSPTDLRLA